MQLLDAFSKVEKIARASKFRRMLYHPVKYFYAILFREVFSKMFRSARLKKTKLFWGKPFYVNLPAGTDIFLTGGKSDDSELRLAKLIMQTLKPGDSFVDIGAHFGYYSVLAAECVGATGKVYAFEASERNFWILKQNASGENIQCFNKIVSREERAVEFYEFPASYSEYNSLYPDQYEKQSWYKKTKAKVSSSTSVTLDNIFASNQIHPSMIKIDTEGAEYDVLLGGREFLQKNNDCIIIMEYLCARRDNRNHQKAVQLLLSLGFRVFVITDKGQIESCKDVEAYLLSKALESDNLVFIK